MKNERCCYPVDNQTEKIRVERTFIYIYILIGIFGTCFLPTFVFTITKI